ncbi:hypothetical protein [Nocardiopsis aegyptia]|uniref:Uncharacterized protein n=1 Tax=Nocardiopsis aegyptia TaxID=220378 RepID=A0A7Z0EIT6_9ACTN|nr:hypothetical protein [Nocardiopsis aegyptia]NYJ32376.1 hypothetical protein [Nocardiopsis aegyptia]
MDEAPGEAGHRVLAGQAGQDVLAGVTVGDVLDRERRRPTLSLRDVPSGAR